MFALLCGVIMVHFALLVLRHWQPGQCEHTVSQHFTRMLPFSKCRNSKSHSLIKHKVLLGFRLLEQILTSQREFDGVVLTGHPSNGHLCCLPGHLFSHTCHLHALLQQTLQRQDTLISLCSAVNVSNGKWFGCAKSLLPYCQDLLPGEFSLIAIVSTSGYSCISTAPSN